MRANSLTRPLEEAFLKENLAYQVSGGMSYFQRQEVKDILAYLRLIANPDDNLNFLRILNVPRRGLGSKTVEVVTGLANEKACSYYSALTLLSIAEDAPLSPPIKEALRDFGRLIESYRERMMEPRRMAEALKSLINEIDYWFYLVGRNKNPNAAKWKYANVEGLIDSVRAYETDPEIFDPSLYGYLNRISLLTRDDAEEAEDEEKKINLMTIHAAKGLEFDTVFIAGVEQDILPHSRTLKENTANIEEERRLFYVAITRAKRRLYMSCCAARHRRGIPSESAPSPFLEELPQEHLETIEENSYLSENEAQHSFSLLKDRFGTEKEINAQ